MLKLILAWLIVVTAGYALAIDSYVQSDGSVFIKLSPAEAKACADEGGCAIVSQAGMRAAFKQYCGTTL